jgi:hypothetical protein
LTVVSKEDGIVTKRDIKQGSNVFLMQTPAAQFTGSIYRGNDENKRLYASAIRHDGQSSIKKNQLTRRTANSKPTVQSIKRASEESFNQSRHSSTAE